MERTESKAIDVLCERKHTMCGERRALFFQTRVLKLTVPKAHHSAVVRY